MLAEVAGIHICESCSNARCDFKTEQWWSSSSKWELESFANCELPVAFCSQLFHVGRPVFFLKWKFQIVALDTSKVWRWKPYRKNDCYGKFDRNIISFVADLLEVFLWSISEKALCAVMTWPVLRLEHIVYDCAPRLSPLPSSTYADEDMVGKIKQFAMRSHPARLGYCILQRYAAYCCCRWLREMTEWFDLIYYEWNDTLLSESLIVQEVLLQTSLPHVSGGAPASDSTWCHGRKGNGQRSVVDGNGWGRTRYKTPWLEKNHRHITILILNSCNIRLKYLNQVKGTIIKNPFSTKNMGVTIKHSSKGAGLYYIKLCYIILK